jgi:hypothetical protein
MRRTHLHNALPPEGAAMTRWLRTGLLALASLAALPAMASVAPLEALPTAAAPWWAPFDDPVLDGLARAAGGPTAQLAVVRGYAELRTAQARLALAARLREVVDQQRTLLAQADADSAEEKQRWQTALAARAAHWRDMQQTMQGESERAEVTLAALGRRELPALREAVAAGNAVLPQVGLEVPFSLPAGTGQAASLQALQAAAAQARQLQQMLEASELELRASQLRQQAGAETPLAVLDAWQRLLLDADRLAAGSGALAVAWAQLLQAGAADVAPALASRLRGTDPAPRAR